jgi:hypothetical protein
MRGPSFFLSMSLGLLATGAIVGSQGRSAALPPRLDSYLCTTVRPSAAERKLLINGGPITKLLDADASKEVAVFGAVWIDAPVRRYVDAVEDIENFEKGGGFKLTKRISSPPALADFARLRLPEDDVRDLRSCRVGDCMLKSGEKGLQAFRPTKCSMHLTTSGRHSSCAFCSRTRRAARVSGSSPSTGAGPTV